MIKSLIFLMTIIAIAKSIPTQQFIPTDGVKAIAVLRGFHKDSVISGTVRFTQESLDSALEVTVNITGLEEGGKKEKHGFHVHANAITVVSDNITEVCNSAGGHYNPLKVAHGSKSSKIRHIGDFGNIVRKEDGTINVVFKDEVAKLYGKHGIIGRTIVLHAQPDDLGLGGNDGSTKTGNAGARIACGVIGVSN